MARLPHPFASLSPPSKALVDALMEDKEIKTHLTREKILDALEPIKYTGRKGRIYNILLSVVTFFLALL